MATKGKKDDTYSYKGWLNSDSFFRRAFAIAGYHTVATLIIYGAVLLIVFLFIAILAYSGILSPERFITK